MTHAPSTNTLPVSTWRLASEFATPDRALTNAATVTPGCSTVQATSAHATMCDEPVTRSRARGAKTEGMDRTLFSEEHEAFRKAFKQFVEREIVPHQERWREQGQVDREVWRKAGAAGLPVPVAGREVRRRRAATSSAR